MKGKILFDGHGTLIALFSEETLVLDNPHDCIYTAIIIIPPY